MGESILSNTTKISFDKKTSEEEMKAILNIINKSLKEKGYNPITQLVGYLISEDPTYITNHNGARALVRRLDRDKLLQDMVKNYLEDKLK